MSVTKQNIFASASFVNSFSLLAVQQLAMWSCRKFHDSCLPFWWETRRCTSTMEDGKMLLWRLCFIFTFSLSVNVLWHTISVSLKLLDINLFSNVLIVASQKIWLMWQKHAMQVTETAMLLSAEITAAWLFLWYISFVYPRVTVVINIQEFVYFIRSVPIVHEGLFKGVNLKVHKL